MSLGTGEHIRWCSHCCVQGGEETWRGDVDEELRAHFQRYSAGEGFVDMVLAM